MPISVGLQYKNTDCMAKRMSILCILSKIHKVSDLEQFSFVYSDSCERRVSVVKC